MIFTIALALCVVFFVLGIGIGIATQHQREGGALFLIDKVTTSCTWQMAETDALTKVATQLNEACVQHQPRLPDQIRHGSESVVRAAAALKKQVESMSKLMTVFQQSRIKQPQTMAAGDEPWGVRDQERDERALFVGKRAKPGSEVSAAKNLKFDVWQFVAPFEGDTIPGPESFELVHCTGSSSEGFCYFAKMPPVCQKLIVAVGGPSDLQFFAAETLRTRPAQADGRQGYLSTCLFAQKLTGVYRWNSAQCRIVRCADLVSA
jgi:hypothetical protein